MWLIRGEPGDFALDSLQKIEPPVAAPDTGAPTTNPA
jgi:hypothetical protein